jgi:hypothetical protein
MPDVQQGVERGARHGHARRESRKTFIVFMLFMLVMAGFAFYRYGSLSRMLGA